MLKKIKNKCFLEQFPVSELGAVPISADNRSSTDLCTEYCYARGGKALIRRKYFVIADPNRSSHLKRVL